MYTHTHLPGVTEKNDGTTTIIHGGEEFRRVRIATGNHRYRVRHMNMFCEKYRCKKYDRGTNCNFCINKTVLRTDQHPAGPGPVLAPFFFRLGANPPGHDHTARVTVPPPPPPQHANTTTTTNEEEEGEDIDIMNPENIDVAVDLELLPDLISAQQHQHQSAPNYIIGKKRKYDSPKYPLDKKSLLLAVHPPRGKTEGGTFVELCCRITENYFYERYSRGNIRVFFVGSDGKNNGASIFSAHPFLGYDRARMAKLEKNVPVSGFREADTVILVSTPPHPRPEFVAVRISMDQNLICEKNPGYEYVQKRRDIPKRSQQKVNEQIEDDDDDDFPLFSLQEDFNSIPDLQGVSPIYDESNFPLFMTDEDLQSTKYEDVNETKLDAFGGNVFLHCVGRGLFDRVKYFVEEKSFLVLFRDRFGISAFDILKKKTKTGDVDDIMLKYLWNHMIGCWNSSCESLVRVDFEEGKLFHECSDSSDKSGGRRKKGGGHKNGTSLKDLKIRHVIRRRKGGSVVGRHFSDLETLLTEGKCCSGCIGKKKSLDPKTSKLFELTKRNELRLIEWIEEEEEE